MYKALWVWYNNVGLRETQPDCGCIHRYIDRERGPYGLGCSLNPPQVDWGWP